MRCNEFRLFGSEFELKVSMRIFKHVAWNLEFQLNSGYPAGAPFTNKDYQNQDQG